MIKMVCSDLDGTLLQYGKKLIEGEIFDEIRALHDRGILFCPASGRQYTSLRKLFAPVADDCIYLCENGAVVYRGGKVIAKTPMPRALAEEIAWDFWNNTEDLGEEIIRDTIHAGAPFKSIILRYFNPIGAHPTAEIGELPNGVPQNLIPYLTQTAMGIRKELSVFGDDYDTPDGSCIRDYINVVDLAKAHVIAMDRMLGGKSLDNVEIFNLGTGNGVSVLELINTFEAATGVKVPHKIVGRREGDIEKVWANPERANKVLGWKATETLADTLASAWKWQERLRERGIM